MFDKKFVHHFSVFLIWLFSISGILGILNEDYTDWFLSKTPLNLLLTFVILIVNSQKSNLGAETSKIKSKIVIKAPPIIEENILFLDISLATSAVTAVNNAQLIHIIRGTPKTL